jgi:hypothetical protein
MSPYLDQLLDHLGVVVGPTGVAAVTQTQAPQQEGLAFMLDPALLADARGTATRYGLLDRQSALVTKAYSVVTPAVPVADTLEHCAKYINPIHWPEFVRGIEVAVIQVHEDTGTRWRGVVDETLKFGVLGWVKCRLDIQFDKGPDLASTRYKLIHSEGPDGRPVLTRNEGWVWASRQQGGVLGNHTRMWVEKTFQIDPAAAQACLGALAPPLVRIYLTQILAQFSWRYARHRATALGDAAAEAELESLLLRALFEDQGSPLFVR